MNMFLMSLKDFDGLRPHDEWHDMLLQSDKGEYWQVTSRILSDRVISIKKLRVPMVTKTLAYHDVYGLIDVTGFPNRRPLNNITPARFRCVGRREYVEGYRDRCVHVVCNPLGVGTLIGCFTRPEFRLSSESREWCSEFLEYAHAHDPQLEVECIEGTHYDLFSRHSKYVEPHALFHYFKTLSDS